VGIAKSLQGFAKFSGVLLGFRGASLRFVVGRLRYFVCSAVVAGGG
jgi:hypothetical protein